MGNEGTARKIHKVGSNRKKLSDITNTPILTKDRLNEENNGFDTTSQLLKELASLKKTLLEKEEIIEENKRYMEKLWVNYCRKTKQNDEIILHNAQLYKDLMQARDKLKVLQHENTQMSALHKVMKMEMQKKLDDALEQVGLLTRLLETSTCDKLLCEKAPVAPATACKGSSRKRQSKTHREPTSKAKMRHFDGDVPRRDLTTIEDDDHTAPEPCSRDVKMKEMHSDTSFGCISGTNKKSLKTHINEPEPVLETSKSESVIPSASAEHYDSGGRDSTDSFDTSTRKLSGRPARRTASSIGSYKEPPLNTKMRRAA